MNNSAKASDKITGKFSFKSKPPPKHVAPIAENANKNFKMQTPKSVANSLQNVSTVSTDSDCIIVDDSEHGFKSVKSLLVDDGFDDFTADDLTFTQMTTKSNTTSTMDDIYAKYGSLGSNKNSVDTFDIDKQLNSNASYVNAVKKLDENMKQLRASPVKKPTTTSTFKYNVRGAAPIAKSTSPSTSVVNSASINTNLKSLNLPNRTGLTNNGTFKPPTVTSTSTSSSKPATSVNSTVDTSFDTPVLKSYKPIRTAHSPVDNSSIMDSGSP